MAICPLRVRREVTRAARRGTRVSYGDLAERAGGSRHSRGDLRAVAKVLQEMTDEDLTAQRPVRAALAVNSRSNLPGATFYRQLQQYGRHVGSQLAQFVANEVALCADHYGHSQPRRTRYEDDL